MPMLPVPVPILNRFDAILEKRAVAPKQRADYKKWLRYFLDFCTKYPVPEARPDQVRLFIDKLRTKRQTPFQQNQATHAVSLFLKCSAKAKPRFRISISTPQRHPSQNLRRSGIGFPLCPSPFPQRPIHLFCRHSGSPGACGKTAMPLNQNLRNGIPPSPSWQQRSKHDITPERRLKPTPIGRASFSFF